VTLKAAPPAAVLAGASEEMAGTGLALLIVKVEPPDVPPPGVGLLTVMLVLPAAARSEAGTAALNWVGLTYVVESAAPFQFTVDADTKLLPSTVSVKDAPPAVALAGASDETVGTGLALVTTMGDAADVPPPGVGLLTVTLAVPAVAMAVAGTEAVICASLTKFALTSVPFQCTLDEDTKPLPLTVRVKPGPAAVTAAGFSEVTAGMGLAPLISKVAAFEVILRHDGSVTVTLTLPASAICAADTDAVSCDSLT